MIIFNKNKEDLEIPKGIGNVNVSVTSGFTDGVTRSEVEEMIDEAISGSSVDLSPYYTSAQTQDYVQNELADYPTSAETDSAIAEAISQIPGVDLSDYYTSGETDSAIAEAISEIPIPDMSDYYTSGETDSAIAEAISEIPGVDLSDYYTSGETENAIADAIEAAKPRKYNIYALSGDTDAVRDAVADFRDNPDDVEFYWEHWGMYAFPETIITGRTSIHGEGVDLIALYFSDFDIENEYNEPNKMSLVNLYGNGNTEVYPAVNLVNLSNYYTSGETESAISSALTDYYTSGETQSAITSAITSQQFKTINGSGITGEGNLVIEGGGGGIEIKVLNNLSASELQGVYNAITGNTFVPNEYMYRYSDADIVMDSIVENATYANGVANIFVSYTYPWADEKVVRKLELSSAGVLTVDRNLRASDYTNSALTNYYTSAQTESAISSAITNQQFKTINGSGITGTGNLVIEGGGGGSEVNYQIVEDLSAVTTYQQGTVAYVSKYMSLSGYTIENDVEEGWCGRLFDANGDILHFSDTWGDAMLYRAGDNYFWDWYSDDERNSGNIYTWKTRSMYIEELGGDFDIIYRVNPANQYFQIAFPEEYALVFRAIDGDGNPLDPDDVNPVYGEINIGKAFRYNGDDWEPYDLSDYCKTSEVQSVVHDSMNELKEVYTAAASIKLNGIFSTTGVTNMDEENPTTVPYSSSTVIDGVFDYIISNSIVDGEKIDIGESYDQFLPNFAMRIDTGEVDGDDSPIYIERTNPIVTRDKSRYIEQDDTTFYFFKFDYGDYILTAYVAEENRAIYVNLEKGYVQSQSVSTIWSGSQAAYDAISPKDPNTLYIINS